MGLSCARNSLLQKASGDYLWFLDSDDVIRLGAVASLKKIIETNSPDLILCNYHIWRTDQIISAKKVRNELHVKSFSGEFGKKMPMDWNFFQGLFVTGKMHSWSKISKRSLWKEDLKFPEGRYFEDIVTTPRLAVRATNYFYS